MSMVAIFDHFFMFFLIFSK